jgi:hypothetical protein
METTQENYGKHKSTNLLDVFGGKVGVEGALTAFKSLLTNGKGTRPLNFQSNGTFLKFL